MRPTAALQIPMMLNSYEELDYVRDHISERLEKGLAARGFVVLNWGDAGWVHFFHQGGPRCIPTRLGRCGLCVPAGRQTATFELYKINGFHPVALAATDILTGLQTGLIEAFQSPPLFALSNQWFGRGEEHAGHSVRSTSGRNVDFQRCLGIKSPAPVQKEIKASALTAGIALREEIRKSRGWVHSDDAAVRSQRGACR